VDTVFFNVMSYHLTRNRYSSDQLDVATDTSNDARVNVATGMTWFVDDDAGGGGSGSSTSPFDTVLDGLGAASSTDIVLVRAGVYQESLTIDQRVVLRASRGDAIIGLFASGAAGPEEPAPARTPEYPDTFDGRTGP
jgi:hypothetical protein